MTLDYRARVSRWLGPQFQRAFGGVLAEERWVYMCGGVMVAFLKFASSSTFKVPRLYCTALHYTILHSVAVRRGLHVSGLKASLKHRALL